MPRPFRGTTPFGTARGAPGARVGTGTATLAVSLPLTGAAFAGAGAAFFAGVAVAGALAAGGVPAGAGRFALDAFPAGAGGRAEAAFLATAGAAAVFRGAGRAEAVLPAGLVLAVLVLAVLVLAVLVLAVLADARAGLALWAGAARLAAVLGTVFFGAGLLTISPRDYRCGPRRASRSARCCRFGRRGL